MMWYNVKDKSPDLKESKGFIQSSRAVPVETLTGGLGLGYYAMNKNTGIGEWILLYPKNPAAHTIVKWFDLPESDLVQHRQRIGEAYANVMPMGESPVRVPNDYVEWEGVRYKLESSKWGNDTIKAFLNNGWTIPLMIEKGHITPVPTPPTSNTALVEWQGVVYICAGNIKMAELTAKEYFNCEAHVTPIADKLVPIEVDNNPYIFDLKNTELHGFFTAIRKTPVPALPLSELVIEAYKNAGIIGSEQAMRPEIETLCNVLEGYIKNAIAK